MRELRYLINDVRSQTDNTDVNGISDREIVRYFNDAVKSVQAVIFKNNPLSSYFQKSTDYQTPIAGRAFDLPSDCYAQNAVTFVEVLSDSSINDLYSPLQRCWQEDQNSFQGWYTRNGQIIFTGTRDVSLGYSAKVWYFYRVPKWDKSWATVSNVAGQLVTLANIDSQFSSVDRFISFINPANGEVRVKGVSYVVTSPTTITITGDISALQNGDIMVMGKDSSLNLSMPEEVEPYILDYVAKRIYTRNNYKLDGSKIEFFTAEEKADIAAIFGDASQSIQPTPITDTTYLAI